MSFKEALSNFMNSYEEPATEEVKTEQPEVDEVKTKQPEVEQPEEAVNEVGGHERPAPEEIIVEPSEGKDPGAKSAPGSEEPNYNEPLFDLILSEEIRNEITEEQKASLLALPQDAFLEATKVIRENFQPKKSGKISQAMKPSKSEPEEDWTLALFNS